ncbi:uncharacterized protein LOC133894874 isoform X2 [Phragmites australis]|uniref:uncharacterized protein LOC133894874 isoform X2 n=1 Tax=Phragmites australis TaxID=29695 RepID=UPI002D77F38F|nr:uncharacterized protein LOC133894874 isoform X2 [Phragmites australis]
MVFALRTAQSQRPIVNRPFPNLSEYLIRRRPLTRRGQADGGGTHGRRASGRRRRVVVQQAVAQRRQSAASVGGQRRSSAQQEGRGAGSLRLDQNSCATCPSGLSPCIASSVHITFQQCLIESRSYFQVKVIMFCLIFLTSSDTC